MPSPATTFALCTANSLQVKEHDQRLQLSEEEQKHIASRVEELERDRRTVERVLGEISGRHRALAERAHDAVASLDDGAGGEGS